MARTARHISVKATPGRNVRVDPVLRLEDLLQKVQQVQTVPEPRLARRRAAGPAEPGEAGAARQLVAELEARLRALRAPAPKPAAGPLKKRKPA